MWIKKTGLFDVTIGRFDGAAEPHKLPTPGEAACDKAAGDVYIQCIEQSLTSLRVDIARDLDIDNSLKTSTRDRWGKAREGNFSATSKCL